MDCNLDLFLSSSTSRDLTEEERQEEIGESSLRRHLFLSLHSFRFLAFGDQRMETEGKNEEMERKEMPSDDSLKISFLLLSFFG